MIVALQLLTRVDSFKETPKESIIKQLYPKLDVSDCSHDAEPTLSLTSVVARTFSGLRSGPQRVLLDGLSCVPGREWKVVSEMAVTSAPVSSLNFCLCPFMFTNCVHDLSPAVQMVSRKHSCDSS